MRRSTSVTVVAAFLLAFLPAVSAAPTSSLPSVTTGVRPGPAVLYAPAPDAPQLENHDARFRAAPLLVAGTEGYVDGEYLYQDYLYDDWGADTGYNDTANADSAGDVDYPNNRARYGGNAADLVEFRVDPTAHDVAYRVTLNTLLVPDSTIVAIAFDTDRDASTGVSALPSNPGASFPGTDELITAWGTGATHARFAGGSARRQPVDITTDLKANQITIVVPRAVSNPRGKWRTTVAVGLHNPKDHTWIKPVTGAPTADAPGGARPSGTTAIFNVAFRFNEVPKGLTPMDSQQASALGAGEPTRFAHDINFGTLDRKVNRSTVPATGTMVRIFPSRLDTEGGKDYTATPETNGQLQQYSLYVPTKYRPGRAAGLTLMLHSLGEHHWQYNGSKGVQQVGEQRRNLVATAEARGEDGWYQHEAEYDVFEMWNDIASRYTLDPDRVAVSGYSMGGYATYRLASLWPDLFGKAFSTVGPPGDGIWVPPVDLTTVREANTNLWLENTRNVPFLNVVAAMDELVPWVGPRAQNLGAPEYGIRGFEQLGYRYKFVTYTPAEHLTLGVLSYDIPMAASFLGDARVDRNPYHVTFTHLPASDDTKLALVHDHAYWVSGVRLADEKAGSPFPKATVDAFSYARGLGDPATASIRDAGFGPLGWTMVGREWGTPPKIKAENKITLTLTNVRSVSIDVIRAGLDPGKTVWIVARSTAPTTVRVVLGHLERTIRVVPGKHIYRVS